MTGQVRRAATVMLVLFGALFINLNALSLLRAEELNDHEANRRSMIAEYRIERGPIVVGNLTLARSETTTDELTYLRVYSEPDLYSHLTGYYSFVLRRSGLEQAMNDQLTGDPSWLFTENLRDLFEGRTQRGNTIRLTIIPAAQEAARDALAGRTGAVVALDPRTGAVLAAYSNPSYDANVLSSHDANGILEYWGALTSDPENPLLDRTIRETYAPGSTFKIVVAAAALESAGFEPDTAFQDSAAYKPPGTSVAINNYAGGTCAGGGTITLADALRVSCNTVFAELGVRLGAETLINMAERFGYNRTPPHDLAVVPSSIPKDLDAPATAQSAIGQRDVRSTPLQAALIAATVANGGELLKPYVVAEVLDPTGRSVRGPSSGLWTEGRFGSRVVSTRTASLLQEMMVSVVANGTGQRARIPGVRVGGKTGSAENPERDPTAWFIGFADDRIAIAVVLPEAGPSATGGGLAAPIAKAVMQAALGIP